MPDLFKVCMGCPDRHARCHGTCEKYIAAKKKYEEMKAAMDKEKALRADVDSYIFDSKEKIRRNSCHQSMCGKAQRRRK